MNDLAKNIVVWLVLAAILMSVFNSFAPEPEDNNIDYSVFLSEVRNDRVSEVVIADLIIQGERNDGTKFRSVRPNIQDPKLMDDLVNHNVNVIGKEREEPSLFTQLLVAAFPILLILAIFVFFMRQMQGGGGGKGGPMSFGKSKAKLLTGDQINTTFADVAGVDEAKEDVAELVEFLSDPTKFQRLGGRIPKGVLMVGPPGTGKLCLLKRFPVKLRFHSSLSLVQISLKCLSVLVHLEFEICSSKPRSNHPALSLLMRSMRSAVIVVAVMAVVMMSASKL